MTFFSQLLDSARCVSTPPKRAWRACSPRHGLQPYGVAKRPRELVSHSDSLLLPTLPLNTFTRRGRSRSLGRRSLLVEAETHVMQQLGRGAAGRPSGLLLLEGAAKPPAAVANREVRRRDGAAGHALSHLCEHTRCELASDQWLDAKNAQRAKEPPTREANSIQAPPGAKTPGSSVVIEESEER
jgi:hypothetical protein